MSFAIKQTGFNDQSKMGGQIINLPQWVSQQIHSYLNNKQFRTEQS